MKKAYLFALSTLALFLSGAYGASAQGLVPCDNPYGVLGTQAYGCGPCHLLTLFQNIVNFTILLSIIVASLMFVYAGVLYMTSSANPTNITKGKDIFWKVLIGLFAVLAAWLVVNAVVLTLTGDTLNQTTQKFCELGGETDIMVPTGMRTPSRPLVEIGENIRQINQDIADVDQNMVDLREQLANCADPSCAAPINSQIADLEQQRAGLDRQREGLAADVAFVRRGDPEDGRQYVLGSSTYGPEGVQAAMAATSQYEAEVQAAADRYGVDPALVRAVMAVESAGNTNAVSPADAHGLMQITPGTARGLNPEFANMSNAQIRQELKDNPSLNIDLGTKYLSQLQEQNEGDLVRTVAGYNGGQGANSPSRDCGSGFTRWQCEIDCVGSVCQPNVGYVETRKYVPNVLGFYERSS